MKTQTTRDKLTTEFKTKVVIEALREQSTLADIAKELRDGIKDYIEYYNNKRPHQGIDHQIPMTKYAKIAA